MKLKFLALAVGGIMAGAVSAQSANVTLYGVVDTFVSSERTSKGGSSVARVTSGGLSGSRFGLRGSESLGGGLNAVYTIESSVSSDTGGGTIAGRQVFVGLNGGFGSLTMGRHNSPIFDVIDTLDVDGTSFFSVSGNHHAGQVAVGTSGGIRINNSIRYATPNMGGVSGVLLYGAGEGASTSTNRNFGASLTYTGGPLTAALGYQDQKVGSASSQRSWTAGGAFNAGVATLSASYIERKDTATNAKFKGFQAGGAIPFGATTLILNAGQGKVGSVKNTLINVGANYALSKRTTAYARVALSNNNSVSTLDFFHGSGTLAPGADERLIAIGVRHRF